MKKFIVFAIAALIVSGCASKPYQSDPDKSYALNVFTAAAGNTYLRDVSKEKFREIQEEAEQTRKIEGSESGLGGTLLATWAGGLLRGVAYWGVGEEAIAENRAGIAAWMPADFAQSGEEAKEKFHAMLVEAAAKAASQTQFPEWVESVEKVDRYTVRISGGNCSEAKVQCEYGFGMPKATPKLVPSPDFIEGEKAWLLPEKNGWELWPIGVGPFSSFIDKRQFKTKYKAAFPDYEFLRNLSRNLPSWAYVYVAPSNLTQHNFIAMESGGRYDFLTYPVFFHQGEEHYFIKP